MYYNNNNKYQNIIYTYSVFKGIYIYDCYIVISLTITLYDD